MLQRILPILFRNICLLYNILSVAVVVVVVLFFTYCAADVSTTKTSIYRISNETTDG